MCIHLRSLILRNITEAQTAETVSIGRWGAANRSLDHHSQPLLHKPYVVTQNLCVGTAFLTLEKAHRVQISHLQRLVAWPHSLSASRIGTLVPGCPGRAGAGSGLSRSTWSLLFAMSQADPFLLRATVFSALRTAGRTLGT